MIMEDDVKLDYSDVLIRPKRSTLGSRKEVKLERKFKFRNAKWDLTNGCHHYKGIPIMAANMDGVGTFEMAAKIGKKFNMFTCLSKTVPENHVPGFAIGSNGSEDRMLENVALSIGVKDGDFEKLQYVLSGHRQCEIKYICIDVANGYSQRFIEFVKKVRNHYPDHVIIAGNVVTADQTQELILSGADIVKVGIGPGSVCTTRLQTGVGYPQLSAVIECADAAHGLDGHVIADGGCSCPGDVVKAFAGGADFVMLGGMLAGHDEGGGEIIEDDHGRKFVEFYGMSSKTANDKHFEGLKDYRSSEGRTARIPYRGPVAPTVGNILGGLRSALTYVGARKLKQLSKCTTFIRVSRQANMVYSDFTVGN